MLNPIHPVLAQLREWSAVALLAAAVALLPAAGQAQEAGAPVMPDTVVATVGDETITEADIAFAAEDLQEDLGQMAPDQRKPFLVTVLIDMKVMAKAARQASMDQTDIFKRRLQYLEERALRRAFFAELFALEVTEEALQAAYEQATAEFTPQDGVRASHILVATKEDADAIKADLANGKDFAELAREKSIDPSAAQNGGDLGFFAPGVMVAPFEEAAFALAEPGQVSEPVQSQFGWHVIRLEEVGKSQLPTLEALRPQLVQQVLFDAFEAAVGPLKESLEINIPDPVLAAGVKARSEGQGQ